MAPDPLLLPLSKLTCLHVTRQRVPGYIRHSREFSRPTFDLWNHRPYTIFLHRLLLGIRRVHPFLLQITSGVFQPRIRDLPGVF